MLNLKGLISATLVAFVSLSHTAWAQAPTATIPDSPVGDQLRWVLDFVSGDAELGDPTDRFTPDFLKAVPPPTIVALGTQLRLAAFGGEKPVLGRVETDDDPNGIFAIVHNAGDGAAMKVTIHVDPDQDNKIDGLLFQPSPQDDLKQLENWDQLDDLLKELPGTANFGAMEILPDGSLKEVHAFHADTRLAIGSAFKLWILGALAEQVLAGEKSWDEQLAVREEWKSLPSGTMQNEDNGTEYPVSHFANQMISISDNTATDHLLYFVGRENVEAYMASLTDEPTVNQPFLATMEMFRIKLNPDRTFVNTWNDGDVAARRALLDPESKAMTHKLNMLLVGNWKMPIAIDTLEWFASPRELCRVMADLHRLEQLDGMDPLGHALRINPGAALGDAWASIGYKGGSEPGVINLTWLLERQDGRWFAMSIGWNDTNGPVDVNRAVRLATQASILLAREGDS